MGIAGRVGEAVMVGVLVLVEEGTPVAEAADCGVGSLSKGEEAGFAALQPIMRKENRRPKTRFCITKPFHIVMEAQNAAML